MTSFFEAMQKASEEIIRTAERVRLAMEAINPEDPDTIKDATLAVLTAMIDAWDAADVGIDILENLIGETVRRAQTL